MNEILMDFIQYHYATIGTSPETHENKLLHKLFSLKSAMQSMRLARDGITEIEMNIALQEELQGAIDLFVDLRRHVNQRVVLKCLVQSVDDPEVNWRDDISISNTLGSMFNQLMNFQPELVRIVFRERKTKM